MDKKIIKDRSLKEISKAGEVARFYGFQPLVAPTLSKQDFDLTKNLKPEYFPEEKSAILRTYLEDRMMALPQPVMLYCDRPFHGSKDKKRPNRLECTLFSIGSMKSVCECLSIEATTTILNTLGYKNLEVQINSIGDKESISEFQKKVSLFIRKNINAFPADLRQAIKKDIFVLFKENKEEWKNWVQESPKSIDFLSEQSRLHFKEVLEFLEIMEVPYSINHGLMGDPEIATETVFSIIDLDSGETLANGFRWNRLAKKIGHKKDISSTSINISAKLKKPIKKSKLKNVKSDFYLIQFGLEAKLRSFLILRELHKAGVNVSHAIAKDKLSSQIGIAESSGAKFIILVGQKEALENCVVIRNTETRAQEIISIPELSDRAKNLLK